MKTHIIESMEYVVYGSDARTYCGRAGLHRSALITRKHKHIEPTWMCTAEQMCKTCLRQMHQFVYEANPKAEPCKSQSAK